MIQLRELVHRSGSGLRALIREPLLQFLVLGAGIFVVAEILADFKQTRQQLIVVDEGVAGYLKNLHHAQFGVYPDPNTLEQLVHSHVRDEILYREALQLGLAEHDEIIRRRLVQKMEYLLMDREDVSQPDEETLKAYYSSHADEYLQPATVAFEHLYFSDDTAQPAGAEQRAAEVLQAIRAGAEQPGPHTADAFPLQNEYTGLSPRDAERLFGHTELARTLFEAPLGLWTGPYRSGYGWHLVHVRERTPEVPQRFSEARARVLTAWQIDQRRRQLNQAIEELRRHYTVQRSVGVGTE